MDEAELRRMTRRRAAAAGLAVVGLVGTASATGYYGRPSDPLSDVHTGALSDTNDTVLLSLQTSGPVSIEALAAIPSLTADPTSVSVAEIWYRSDTDELGIGTSSGTVHVAPVDPSTLDSTEHGVIGVRTGSGAMTFSLRDASVARHNFVRIRTQNHGVLGLHSPETLTWSTNTDWNNAQSSNSINITSGSFSLTLS